MLINILFQKFHSTLYLDEYRHCKIILQEDTNENCREELYLYTLCLH
jgi:hypothetical protein